jgi:hypothetical protein
MNPILVGEAIGLDKATVTRIMNELVGDNYIDSGLGMKMLLIRNEGLKYLRKFETETNPPSSINISVGDNSNFQFQNNSPNSKQIIHLKEQRNEDLLKLIQEINVGLDILKKHLCPNEIDNLKTETNYLESSLNKQVTDKSLLKTVTNNIFDILKAVPSNVIANIITNIIH